MARNPRTTQRDADWDSVVRSVLVEQLVKSARNLALSAELVASGAESTAPDLTTAELRQVLGAVRAAQAQMDF